MKTKKNTYVIGDIHGTYLALVQVLKRCGFRYGIDELITLGDIVDGHADSYRVVEELLKIANRIDIMGNHDQWFHEFIISSVHPDEWSQGGLGTAKSYADAIGLDLIINRTLNKSFRRSYYTYQLNLISDDITESHQNFFKRQHKCYKDDNNNVFVHGGINRFMPLKDQLAYHMMWNRTMWDQALSSKSGGQDLNWSKMGEDINLVFIGHTTTQRWGTDKPMKASNVWNLDTGAGGDGKLTIMNVETEEYWQSDNIHDLYPDSNNYR